MTSIRKDFPLHDIHYLDSATKSVAPLVKSEISSDFSRDYHIGIGSKARKQSSIYLALKEELARYLGGDPERIALVANRELAWNLILYGLKENHSRLYSTWSEESAILGPSVSLYSVQFIDNTIPDNGILAYSSIDPLTGQKRQYSLGNIDITIIDASYDLSSSQVADYDADIIIAELSIDMLSPFPLGLIYFKNDVIDRSPFSGTGSIAKFTETEIIPRSDIQKFELGTLDTKILIGALNSIRYLSEFGSATITQSKDTIREDIIPKLQELESVNILNFDHNLDPIYHSHLSLNFPHPSHDIALLLDEMHQVEVRSGRICSHLALDRLKLDDVIRVSWHIYNDTSDVNALVNGLNQILAMFS